MKLSYNDRMLNDWGVHHLHLGDHIQRNGFIDRTKALLFCRFEQDDAYFVDILSHDYFFEQNLGVIMHENWPDMLRRHRLNGIKGAPITNAEISALREKNCN